MKRIYLLLCILLLATSAISQTTPWTTTTTTSQTRKLSGANQIRWIWGSNSIFSLPDTLAKYMPVTDSSKYSNYILLHSINIFYHKNTFNDTLVANQTIISNGSIAINGPTHGITTPNASIGTLNVTGNATIGNNLNVTGGISATAGVSTPATSGFEGGEFDFINSTNSNRVVLKVTGIPSSGSTAFIKSGGGTIAYTSDIDGKADTGGYVKRTVGVIHFHDSTAFASYSGLATVALLRDSLVGGSCTFIKLPKGSYVKDGGIRFASNSSDSLWFRQYNYAVGINIQWYGAKADWNIRSGNTGTDSYSAITRAISEALRSGGYVTIPMRNKAFGISAPLKLLMGTHLKGYGGSLFPYQTGALYPLSDTLFYNPLSCIYAYNNTNCAISQDGVVNYRNQGIILEGITWAGTGRMNGKTGILLTANINTTASANTTGLVKIIDCSFWGFSTLFNGTKQADSHWIINCHFSNGQRGILTGNFEPKIHNCIFYDLDVLAIQDNSTGANIAGNEIQPGFGATGIRLNNSIEGSYYDNRMRPVNIGFDVDSGASSNKIFGNHITDAHTYAVYTHNLSNNNSFHNNEFKNANPYAKTGTVAVFNTSANNNEYTGNHFRNLSDSLQNAISIVGSTLVEVYDNIYDGTYISGVAVSTASSSTFQFRQEYGDVRNYLAGSSTTTYSDIGFKAAGTLASPTVNPTADIIRGIYGRGYNGTGFTLDRVGIRFVTEQAFTSSNNGTGQEFYITPLNSTTLTKYAELTPSGWNIVLGKYGFAGSFGAALNGIRVNAGNSAMEYYDPLASPAFTGTPTAPTAAIGTSTTQLSNTAFVQAAITVKSLFTNTGTATVTNTVTATTIIPTGNGSMTPTTVPVAGTQYLVQLGGIYTVPIGAGNFTVTVTQGSTVLATGTMNNFLGAGGTNLSFDGGFRIANLTIGASGTETIAGGINFSTGNNLSPTRLDLNNSGAVITKANTTAEAITVTVAWATASTTRSFTVNNFSLDQKH